MAARLLRLAVLLAWPAAVGGNAVIDLDLFRAIRKADLDLPFENVDLASLPGLLNFLHTEVVGEHFPKDEVKKRRLAGENASAGLDAWGPDDEDETEEEEEEGAADRRDVFLSTGGSHRRRSARPSESGRRRVRTERHKGVDIIVRTSFKVRNPTSLLNSPQVKHVDFGPGVRFANGEAQTRVPKKGGYGRTYKWDYGDFVGVGEQKDRRYRTYLPGFWFSFSGFCPNLKWPDKRDNKTGKLSKNCMTFGPENRFLMGGLCQNRTVPDGSLGCTYTYRPVAAGNTVDLDELSGLLQEDCGGRKCRSWLDFRKNCTSSAYKRRFNYRRRGKIVRTRECVEYDVHPACQKSCGTRRCRAVPESRKEVGLPFWRGRCSAARNAWRVEQVAVRFGIAGAMANHTILSPRVRADAATCLNANRTAMCSPRPEYGYMYCTRHWAGVCEACRIPNAEKSLARMRRKPMCPWNVLNLADYAGREGPRCRSKAPRDLCCLYSGTCNVTAPLDPAAAADAVPLDADGYAIMTSRASTEAMKAFLVRCHSEFWQGEVADEEGLTSFAYWQWNAFPIAGRTFAKALKDSKPFFVYPPTSTTTTPTTTGTTHTVTVPETTGAPLPTTAPKQAATTKASGASRGGAPPPLSMIVLSAVAWLSVA